MIMLSRVRNNIVLVTIWLYLLLNYGFMQIRFLSVPVGELVLLLSLATINYKVVLPKFLNNRYIIPLLIWWGVGLGHILWNLPQYGIWAIRDASHIIESLFILVGFTFAGSAEAREQFKRWLPWMLSSVVLYSLTYPFRELLQPYSPILSGAQGQSVILFFNYTNTQLVIITYCSFCLQQYLQARKEGFLYLAIGCLTLVLLLFPSRTLFVEMAIFLAFWLQRLSMREFRQVAMLVTVPVILLAGIFAIGIPINGRFGTEFQLSDYLTIITEIFHRGENVQTITSGNEIRFLWWSQILRDWSHSWLTMLFGLGYGMPLVNFVGDLGAQVREPHNDVIGILARGGLVALLSLLWFQAVLLFRSFRLVDYLGRGPSSSFVVALLFLLICTLLNAVGESPFIMAFYAVPFYFAAGVLLRMYTLRKEL